MNTVTIEQALQMATGHHSAGRLPEAEGIYRQILAQEPQQPQALQLLGVLAHQVGRSDLALDYLHQSLAVLPNDADAHINITEVFRALGRLDEAVGAGRRATELVPASPAAWLNYGTALKDRKSNDEAAAALEKAIELEPLYSRAFNNLGIVRQNQERFPEAFAAYHRAIELEPTSHDAWNNLGTAHLEQNRLAEAVDSFRHSLALEPNSIDSHTNLADALNKCEAYADAAAHARRAIELNPRAVEAYYNLANALQGLRQIDEAVAVLQQLQVLTPQTGDSHNQLGNALQLARRFEESEASYKEALRHTPDSARVHSNLGMLYYRMARLDDAEASFRRALEIDPEYTDAHFNQSLVTLHRGDFAAGWKQYEWRRKVPSHLRFQRHNDKPMWDGSEAPEATILLHTEQGLGDALQVIRYAPLVRARVGRVIVECQPELLSLMRTAAGIDEVIARGAPVPDTTFQIPLLSLPFIFGTDLHNIPNHVPYLQTPAERLESWRERLAQPEGGPLRVGLVWAGNPGHSDDQARSCPPEALGALARCKNTGRGVVFYSLQKGHGAASVKWLPPELEVIDLGPDILDFADSAAILGHLDLLITVDTATAHLAGALGREVWTLLSYRGEWRWLLDRTDSPWYPSMKIFRQSTPGDWNELLDRVATALAEK